MYEGAVNDWVGELVNFLTCLEVYMVAVLTPKLWRDA